MQAAPIVVAALAIAAVPACHPDACVWDVERVRSETTIGATRDGTALAIAADSSAGAYSSRDSESENVESQLSFGISIDGDSALDRVVITIELPGTIGPGTHPLTDLDATVRLLVDSSVIDESQARAGLLTMPTLVTPCEYSDTYLDTGAHWVCATDIDATVDLPFSVGGADYRLVAQVSQRETMDVTCYECTGIEGCDY